jgi:hypothetical protein
VRPVLPLTALYMDFQSRHCYRVWRWLGLLPDREHVEVRPYSVELAGSGEESPWERGPSGAGLELLALAEYAREHGSAVHHRFVDAAFGAVHEEDDDTSGLETWLALGNRLELDMDTFTADTDRWRAEVTLWHTEAADELGVTAVPTLVFAEAYPLYVRLVSDVQDTDGARQLLGQIAELVRQPIGEVRRP